MIKPRKPVLPTIPDGYRLTNKLTFIKVPELTDNWVISGRAQDMPIGELISVWRFSTKEYSRVEITGHIAARTVHHRPGGYTHSVSGASTDYVLASFVNVDDE